ncbi:MAG: hypothetical protein ACE10C_01370 [Candidatus Binatia bacterium]|jgi:hypothetical protein
MGITYIGGLVIGTAGNGESVRFLIDRGVTYSLLPKVVWEAIELVPKRETQL